MPLQLTIHHGLPYLLIDVSGATQLPDLLGITDFVAAACAAIPRRRCLLDMRAMHHSLPFTEHLQLGTHAGEKLRALEKIAAVIPPELHKGTTEKVARKLGTQLRAFTDMDEAKAWLAEGNSR